MTWRLTWRLTWQVAVAALVGVLTTVAMLRLSGVEMIERVEASLIDLRFRLRVAEPTPVPVTLVAIDDFGISAVGRWPWSREIHARLLNGIRAAGPKVIGIDLLFTEEQSPEADSMLAGAVERSRPVILPFAVDLAPSGMAPSLPPPAPNRLTSLAYPRHRGSGPDRLPQATRLRLPVGVLTQAADLAHVSIVPDASGSFRYDYTVLRYGDDYYPSLSIEATRLFRDLRREDVVVDLGRGIRMGNLRIPTDGGMRLLVNYRPPGSFDTVSAVDVLDGRVPPERFAGRIVLIGTTAIGIGDVQASPHTPTLPGVERHAMLIASMLTEEFIRRDDLTAAIDAVVIVICAILVGLGARRGTGAAALVSVLLLACVALLNMAVFARFGLWLNLLFPLLSIVLTLAAMLAGEHFSGKAALARMQEQARRDPLTGLPNRAGMASWLLDVAGPSERGKVAAREAGQGLARTKGRGRPEGLLVFVGDLDGFKQVNDTHGHHTGDRLLQEAAARMVHAMRQTDLVARMGGDEFVLVFALREGATVATTLPAVQRVFDSVVAPYSIDGVVMTVGLSLGGAVWPTDDADITRVMKLADSAVYAAKKQGKGRIALHELAVMPEPLSQPSPIG